MPISPSKRSESEAREVTVTGSDQHTGGRSLHLRKLATN